jgi:catechol 2,3-dioxygenase-like lactoylglutathione lyase family enzyme
VGHFAPVQVNDSLTLDFDNRDQFERHHYAFHVSEEEFDQIFGRLEADGLTYGSGPRSLEDMEINRRRGGRGVYFRDPDGHVLELLTRT